MKLKMLIFGILGYLGAIFGWNAWASINNYPHWLIYIVEFTMLSVYMFACWKGDKSDDD